MLELKHALLASLCLLPVLATDAMAATAGVTAAVNQNAKSTPPGGGIRTVVLGANVVQDETIETDGGGLVQILLADGTTFTVGPNSSITIDRFVYDPDANTAQVSASLGRGVFRFIGGRTSKTEGGVQLSTPVGTVGIRGGMADLNFSGNGGTIAQIDLLFGNEITLGGDGGQRLFQAGYSIIIGANGAPSVVKTPPGSASFIQQALAGRPGSSGGSPQKPTDSTVAGSEVTETNSGSTPPPTQQQIPPPDLRAIDLATPKPNDNHQVAEEVIPEGPKTLSGKYYGYSSAYVFRDHGPGQDVEAFYRNIVPSDVEFNFIPGSNSMNGHMTIDELGNPPGTITVSVGPLAGGNAVYLNDLYYYATGPASGITVDGVTATGGNGTNLVSFGIEFDEFGGCTCEFMQAGYWVANANVGTDNVSTIGTFVVGDLLKIEDYADDWQFSGTATYEGTALGLIRSGSDEYASVGDMRMVFDLGSRDGDLYLDIDGKSFTTDVSAFDENGVAEFSGSSNVGGQTLNTNGAFAKDGTDLTAGVIGGFDATEGNWSASGVYAGERTSLVPNNN